MQFLKERDAKKMLITMVSIRKKRMAKKSLYERVYGRIIEIFFKISPWLKGKKCKGGEFQH